MLVLCLARRKKTEGQLTTNRAQRRLAFYAEVQRKKTKSTDVWIYTNRTNNGETST